MAETALAVFGIVPAAIQLVQTCREFHKAWRNHTTGLTSIDQDLDSVRGTFKFLQSAEKKLIDSNDPDFTLIAEYCGSQIKGCDEELQKLKADVLLLRPVQASERSMLRTLREMRKKAKYAQGKKRLVERRDAILKEMDSHLSKALTILVAKTQTREIVDRMLALSNTFSAHDHSLSQIKTLCDEMHPVLARVDNNVTSLVISQAKEDIKRVLGPDDQNTQRYMEKRANMAKDTGGWTLHVPEFISWMTSTTNSSDPGARCLWIHGEVGFGKTTLCSFLIDELNRSFDDDSRGLTYAYFSGNRAPTESSNRLTYDSMLRTTLWTLIDGATVLPPCLGELSKNKTVPDVGKMEQCFAELTRGRERVFLVIDGVDECPSKTNCRSQLQQGLLRLLEQVPNLALLVVSRFAEMSTFLAPFHPQVIKLDYTKIDQDIQIYLAAELDEKNVNLPRTSRLSSSQRQVIKTSLLDRSRGMFQWVYCMLCHIECWTPMGDNELKETLNAFPSDLAGTYERILTKIEGPYQTPLVRRALQWMACYQGLYRDSSFLTGLCDSTFRVAEFAAAVSFDPEMPARHADQVPIEMILSSAPGLIRVAPHTSNVRDGDRPVTFSHVSVKDFLLSSEIQQGPAEAFAVVPWKAHEHLAKSCLAYVQHSNADSALTPENWREKYPLLAYAASDAMIHQKQAENDPDYRGVGLKEDHDTIFAPKAKKTLEASRRIFPWTGWLFQDDLPQVYRYCLWGLPVSLSRLLQRRLPNTIDGLGHNPFEASDLQGYSLLHGAVNSGSSRTLNEVLKLNPDVNAMDAKGKTALHCAALGENPVIVKILLERGALYTVEDGHGRTALEIPSTADHAEIVTLLLESDTSDRMAPYKQKAVYDAAQSGRDEVVARLLDHGVNADGGPELNGYPLFLAIDGGHFEVVHRLLNHGANPMPVVDGGEVNFLPLISERRDDWLREIASSLGLDDNGLCDVRPYTDAERNWERVETAVQAAIARKVESESRRT